MSDYNPIPPQFRPNPADETPSREKKWLDAIEEKLKEAQERGDFDNLAGKGKPLDLRGNPHAGDWEMAYKAMSNAGYAPEWIERDKEIRLLIEDAQRTLDRHVAWHADAVDELARLSPKQQAARRNLIATARENVVRRYRDKVNVINSKITNYNLICPVPSMQRFKLRVDEDIQKFEARLTPVP